MTIHFLKALNEAITRHDEMVERMNNMEEGSEISTSNHFKKEYKNEEQPKTLNDKFLAFLGLWDSLYDEEEKSFQKTK